MQISKIIYWLATGLLCALILFSAGMYFLKNDMIVKAFNNLGYPTYLIYPLAIAKIFAVIAILSKLSPTLKEWAYVGLFFDFILAFAAHIIVGDEQFGMALIALILWLISYFLDRKLFRGSNSIN